MKQTILFAFLLLIQQISFAQTIKGTVIDKNTQQPIGFCTVSVPTKNKAVLTDENGNFILQLSNIFANEYLVFQSIDYETDSVKLEENKFNYRIFLSPKSIELTQIVVTGSTYATKIKENPISMVAISPKQIATTNSTNIIDVLVKNAPGMTAVKTGPNISKPFIHGLGYNRVLTLYDGIRQEGQQYGDEHGLEVDDYNIDRAEVVKGPASLLYGSDAIAGVISLFPALPRAKDGKIHGQLTSEYQSNNNLIGNGLRIGFSNRHWLFALRGSYRMAKNYRNPIDGRVYLTNFNVANFSALAGYSSAKGHTYINFTLYDNHQGIPDGSRDSLTRQFTHQVFEGEEDVITQRPLVTEKMLNSYKVPDLSQHIQHYRAYVKSFYRVGNGTIDAVLGGQQNIRREFAHPTMPKQAGMFMRLNTLNYSLRYNAPEWKNIRFSVGMNGMLQQNKNEDATDFPIPDYRLADGGFYLFAQWKRNRWTISGGIRYDLRFVAWNDFYVAENFMDGFEQKATANTVGARLQFENYRKLFQGVSGSLGTTFQINENISLKANIGRAYRSPNLTEIGSNGLDPGAHIIYLGNRNFKSEFSLQEDLGVHFSYENITAEASFFNNNIQNYIYMEAVADAQGNPLLDAQGNRTNTYKQAAAQLFGTEMFVTVHPKKWKGFQWKNTLATVYGFNKAKIYRGKGTQGEFLPLIPPLMATSELLYSIRLKKLAKWTFTPKAGMEFNAEQNRFLGLNGTETFTPQYTLFSLGATIAFEYLDNKSILFVFEVNNLLNKAYQSHLNRLKYFEYYQQSPDGHFGIYNMGRNLTFKVVVPF